MKKKSFLFLIVGLLAVSLCSCEGKAQTGTITDTTDPASTDTTGSAPAGTTDPGIAKDTAVAPQSGSGDRLDPALGDDAKEGDTRDDAAAGGGSSESVIPPFTFETVTIDGDPVDDSIFKDSRVTMINFWEPWCGPCVAEMPDLERIYRDYKDKGFSIVGVYTASDMDEEARQILSECGTTYPILVASETMFPFMTGYVPTTIFVDSEGRLLSNTPVVGSNTYDSWAGIIDEFL